MERAVRNYIIRILLAHLAALVVVVVVVAYAGTQVYTAAREQGAATAIDQAARPVRQAAESVRRHLSRVFDALALAAAVDPADPADAATRPIETAVWPQLRDLASDLLVVEVTGQGDRAIAVVRRHLSNERPDAEAEPARSVELVGVLGDATGTALSGPMARAAIDATIAPDRQVLLGPTRLDDVDGRGAAVTAVHVANTRKVLLAVVPAAYLDRSFLALSREPGRLDLQLVDLQARPLVDSAATGSRAAWPASLTQFVRGRLEGRSLPPTLIETRADIGGELFEGLLPAVSVILGPVDPDGKALTAADETSGDAVTARSVTAGVAGVLNADSALGPLRAVSRTSSLWALMLIVAVSTILVSSSVQLIRGRSRLERLRSEVVEKELDAARQIQLRWLPGKGGRAGGDALSVAAENLPASHISGDFYNFFDLPDDEPGNRVAMVVGDVTGHGMAAAFLMSTTQLLVESALKRLGDPGRALTEVNALLSRQNHGGQFVTLILAIVDLEAREMQLASAGHPGPLRCDTVGRWHDTDVDADLVAGVMEDVEYQTTVVPLDDVKALLFYTDGAVEAQDAAGERFDLRRLAEGLRSEVPGGPDDARDLVDAGLRVVRGFAGGVVFEDDVTFLAAVLDPADDPADAADTPGDAELVEA